MFCPSCGRENRDDANFCESCGRSIFDDQTRASEDSGYRAYQAPSPSQLPYVPNYLVQAILVTIFCCLPAGIVSIIYAAQVNGKREAGDLAGAQQSSQNARTWAWVSFGVGLAGGLIWILLLFGGLFLPAFW